MPEPTDTCAAADTCVGDPGCETYPTSEACQATGQPCPTCSGPIRETVGMVCQTCGTDYAPAEGGAR